MTREEGYQGWPNYETWAINVHLSNVEGHYRYWRDMTRRIVEADTIEAAQRQRADMKLPPFEALQHAVDWRDGTRRRDLADRLRADHEARMPSLASGWASDLLGVAFGRVDWLAISASMLADYVAEEGAGE